MRDDILPATEVDSSITLVGPTLAAIRSWPATVPMTKACEAVGISRAFGYELAARGEFPAHVIKVGGRVRVVTASLVALLDSNATAAGGDAA